MKRVALTVYFVSVIFAAGAKSQTMASRLKADIPFDFSAGTQTLSAGAYAIDTPLPNVVRISAVNGGGRSVFVIGDSATRGADIPGGRFEFRLYGNRHFLARIWPASGDRGLAVRPSALQRELQARGEAGSSTLIAAVPAK